MSEYSFVRETPPAGWEAILGDRNMRTFVRTIKAEALRKKVALTDLPGIKTIMKRHLDFERYFKAIPREMRAPTVVKTVGAVTRINALTVKHAAGSAEATLLAAVASNESVMRPCGMDYSVRATAMPDDAGAKVFAITVIDE